MEYLLGLVLCFGGWMVLRFLLTASYASGFAEGAWQVTNGGIARVGELARPVDAKDLEKDINAQSQELNRLLSARNFDQASVNAKGFGQELVSRAWKLRSMLRK